MQFSLQNKTKLGKQLHFYKGLKLRFSYFFTEKENSVIIYSVIPQATAVWQMLLYKWNFSWLMLSCRTREEKYKNSTSSRNFHSLHKTTGGESLTKTATYLNYCRMLCTYSIEHIALFQVSTILRIWECQSIKVYLMLDTSMCQLNSFTGGSHKWLNETQIESVNHSVSNPCVYLLSIIKVITMHTRAESII